MALIARWSFIYSFENTSSYISDIIHSNTPQRTDERTWLNQFCRKTQVDLSAHFKKKKKERKKMYTWPWRTMGKSPGEEADCDTVFAVLFSKSGFQRPD